MRRVAAGLPGCLLDDLERVLHALHDVELLHRHPALVEEREGEAAPHLANPPKPAPINSKPAHSHLCDVAEQLGRVVREAQEQVRRALEGRRRLLCDVAEREELC